MGASIKAGAVYLVIVFGGFSVLDGGTVSEHVNLIELSHGWDHENPNVELAYEFSTEVTTDGNVVGVKFITSKGREYKIPDLPEHWDDVNEVWTSHGYDEKEQCYWWKFEGDSDDESEFLEKFPDGFYTYITEDDDLRLSAGSPCIDAGDNKAALLGGAVSDLAGRARITGKMVDMGAYEFGFEGDVDFVDFAKLAGNWLAGTD